jgi:hypothetical protein
MELFNSIEELHELLCWGLVAFGVASGLLLLCSDLRAPYGRYMTCLSFSAQSVDFSATSVTKVQLGSRSSSQAAGGAAA